MYNNVELYNKRNNEKLNKFQIRKNNTLYSLKEVERFLKDFKKVLKGIKLYNILK